MGGITQEHSQDSAEVEALLDLCFVPGRQALSSYRLRDGVDPLGPLCLVYRDETEALVGAVRCWPVRVGGAETVLLGPLAVHPTREGEGLGSLLMTEVMARAEELGQSRILLVGDAPYYARFGYRPLATVRMPPPTNPDRVLGMALVPGAWNGVSGAVTKGR